jgi:hypothetical protein
MQSGQPFKDAGRRSMGSRAWYHEGNGMNAEKQGEKNKPGHGDTLL